MNGYDAQDMAAQGADGFRNGYQAGYADAVKAIEASQPAAAQDAVVWVDIANWRDGLPADECFFSDYQDEDTIPLYAAPVTAAPVATIVAAMRNFADVDDRCQITEANAGSVIRTWAGQLEASTPAAPGIDLAGKSGLLRRARSLFDQDREYALERGDSHHAGQCTKDIASIDALIDASPKGGSEAQQAGAQAIAIVHMDGYRWNGKLWQKDSPKEGIEAAPDDLSAFLRWCADELTKRDNTPGMLRRMVGVLKDCASSIEYVARVRGPTQAGDAEVRP